MSVFKQHDFTQGLRVGLLISIPLWIVLVGIVYIALAIMGEL